MAEIGYARALIGSGAKPWGNAILEVAVIAGVSLIPLMGAAVREMLPADSTIYLGDAFSKAFFSGQLLFYALGFIATIVWQCNKDLKSFYPLRALFNLYCMAGLVFCAIVIGYDPTLNGVNKVFLNHSSVWLFLSSVGFYVLMAVISQVHVNVGEELARSDDALSDAVRRSRGLQ